MAENTIVIQRPLEIAAEVYEKVLAGELNLLGGVVRNLNGTVYQMLPDALEAGTEEVAEKAVSEVANAVSTKTANKGLSTGVKCTLIGVGVVVLVSGIIGITKAIQAYNRKKDEKIKAEKDKTILADFNKAMAKYVKAVAEGKMRKEILDDLILHIDFIKETRGSANVKIEISLEQLETLINLMHDYSIKLAELNSVKSEKLIRVLNAENDHLAKVQHCLKFQRDIFEGKKAA